MFTSLAKLLSLRPRPVGRTGPARRRGSVRLSCEPLESRVVLSTFGEFHVNSATQNNQYESANASSASGRSVVVWRHQYSDYDADIHAQIYNADGSKFGSPIPVAVSSRNETDPTVAMDADGNFVVAWTYMYSSSDLDIRAARFSANGTRIGSEIAVVGGSLNEREPSVALANNGTFMVAYTFDRTYNDPDVMVRMFSSTNAFVREIATYNSTYLGYATPDSRPSVAASPDGRFVVAYQRGYADTFSNRTAASDIVVNRYDAAGNRHSIQYMGSSSGVNANPSVSMDYYGNSVVVYQSLVGNDFDVKARRITNAGGLGAELTISQSYDDEATPVVALDPTNDKFVVAYTAYVGSSTRLEVREVSANDSVGAAFVAGYGPFSPALSISRDGTHRYLLTYTGSNYGWSDPGYGIFGRFGSLA